MEGGGNKRQCRDGDSKNRFRHSVRRDGYCRPAASLDQRPIVTPLLLLLISSVTGSTIHKEYTGTTQNDCSKRARFQNGATDSPLRPWLIGEQLRHLPAAGTQTSTPAWFCMTVARQGA
jgi:hypothetical protein